MRALTAIATCLLLLGCPAGDETQPPIPGNGSDAKGAKDSSGSAETTTGGDDDASTGGDDIVEAEDTYVPPPCTPGLPCDDKLDCTVDDKCVDGLCQGEAYSCDDGRPCTVNNCDGVGGCEFPVDNGWCLLNNVCIEHGSKNGENDCERCDTDLNKIGWSKVAEDAGCEDGNPCTFGDWCKKGECKKGLKATCDDDNECTIDACDKLSGCAHTPASGPCNDSDPCTADSVCSGGVCHAPSGPCDDQNPCTTDTCLPDLGCEFVPIEGGACEDGDACTSGDACQGGACVSGPKTNCDDATVCTEDKCDALFGCYHTLTSDPCCNGAEHLCDDGNPCTTDTCQAGSGGCVNTNNTQACEDGDQCTGGDKCAGGECQTGTAAPCDDGNPCTTDSCNEAAGCQNAPKLGGCNDGIACTTNDACDNGQCVGDTSQCKCDPDFALTVSKATQLVLGTKAEPGMGLDVDENPNTCAPVGQCSGGIDNSLAPLAAFLNKNLQTEIDKGGLVLLLEFDNPKTDGTPFTLRLYAGKKADKSCNHQAPGCDYLVDDATLDEDCTALIELDNAKIVGSKLTAGGLGYNFPLLIPLFGSTYIEVNLGFGRIEADVTISGNKVTINSGLVGGAIPKTTFVTAVELVPEDQLPVPKETIVQLLDVLVKNDIDALPPAGPDSASVGLQIKGVPGTIIGVAN